MGFLSCPCWTFIETLGKSVLYWKIFIKILWFVLDVLSTDHFVQKRQTALVKVPAGEADIFIKKYFQILKRLEYKWTKQSITSIKMIV